MKKTVILLLTVIVVFLSVQVQAQWNGSTTINDRIWREGQIVIAPQGSDFVNDNGLKRNRPFHLRSSTAMIQIDRDGDDPGLAITRYHGGFTSVRKSFYMYVRATGTNQGKFVISDWNTSVSGASHVSRLTIENDGFIGINLGANVAPSPGANPQPPTAQSPLDLRLDNERRVQLGLNDESSLSFVPNNSDDLFHLHHGHNNTLQLSSGTNPGTSHVMSFANNGVVSVGTAPHDVASTTPDYFLYVEKGIRTEEAKLDLKGTWPDYVFENTYQLRPLKELAKFIEQNKHLPEVPSASEVAEDGIKVGAMQATLLKKIEELTLYILEQDQEKEALQAENQALKNRLEKLEQIVQTLVEQNQN